MRKIVALILFAFAIVGVAHASSPQAYQDYLYQFDLYRQSYTDFGVAKNEYQKFKSLESQTAALDKTRLMLVQRDNLLRAYLLLLNEKLNETAGMIPTEKQLYQTLIRSEVTFLENHIKLIPSVGSLEDAVTVSKQLESHYLILQKSMRQTIIGISVGDVNALRREFDRVLGMAQALTNAARGTFTPQKQVTIDRWLLQITNKRSLYQQKIDSITSENAIWEASNGEEMNRKFLSLQQKIGASRQELLEASGFLTELVNTLRYVD
ncbi:hypothetical protein HYV22_01740 [Candidatus Gottesmanbacteria bacterium]|nr:hypothetical protein [Candidatus Gottesmanbacteria bacterium]